MTCKDPDQGWVIIMEPQEQEQLESLLMGSIIIGDETTVRKLLDKGLNVNFHDSSGDSVLHLGVEHGDLTIIELLLHEGANVNVKDRKGCAFCLLCGTLICLGQLLSI